MKTRSDWLQSVCFNDNLIKEFLSASETCNKQTKNIGRGRLKKVNTVALPLTNQENSRKKCTYILIGCKSEVRNGFLLILMFLICIINS